MFSSGMDEKLVEKYFNLLDPAESKKLPTRMSFRIVDVNKAKANPHYKDLVDKKNVLIIGGKLQFFAFL
jgi:hypothetical protein